MRGKVETTSQEWGLFGITPAYAGKREARGNGWCRTRDHPRVCGEKQFSNGVEFRDSGSPPRMRGKDFYRTYKVGDTGITPAYAGKSRGMQISTPFFKDHPRVCGEKMFLLNA